jgi:hypothetical protein
MLGYALCRHCLICVSDESVSSKVALDLSINQIMNVLSSQQRLDDASMETMANWASML